MQISDRPAPPPKGFSQIQRKFAWTLFAAAPPAVVPKKHIALVRYEVNEWEKVAIWKRDRGEDWTNLREFRKKHMRTGETHTYYEGDCENLMFELAQRLARAGIDLGALHFLAAELDPGDPKSGHMFLGVETEEGWFLHDCRRFGLIKWGHVVFEGIKWVAITDQGQWKEIET